ncbi:hypothetical protein [Halobacteriovorax sp. CON-3]|uniref:hypothetical protein n=1 Tax=Halobacteriovorax sp. CON-3 TaxID=3157710 RepID=UPI00371E618C
MVVYDEDHIEKIPNLEVESSALGITVTNWIIIISTGFCFQFISPKMMILGTLSAGVLVNRKSSLDKRGFPVFLNRKVIYTLERLRIYKLLFGKQNRLKEKL